MVNTQGLKINLNEAKVLLAAADYEGKGRVNIEAFMHWLKSHNEHIKQTLEKVKCKQPPYFPLFTFIILKE